MEEEQQKENKPLTTEALFHTNNKKTIFINNLKLFEVCGTSVSVAPIKIIMSSQKNVNGVTKSYPSIPDTEAHFKATLKPFLDCRLCLPFFGP